MGLQHCRQPISSSSYDTPPAAAGNYLNLMMRRLPRWAVLGGLMDHVHYQEICSQIPLIRVVFFWVSLVLMIVLLMLINTNQTRPSLLNHHPFSSFLVIFCSTLLFLLSAFALVMRAFVWPSRGPLRKLGLAQSLFWYVIGVMGCAYVDSVVQGEDTNSLVAFLLLAVLSIPFSNVILHTNTNLGLMDSLVGLCASLGYEIAKQKKLVGFFVITLFVVCFGTAKFYSESYKSQYGAAAKGKDVDDDDIEKGYATRNIIESLETAGAIDKLLLSANVDWGVFVGFDQIEEMVRSAIHDDASRNVIGYFEATLLHQLLMGLVTEELMVTAFMDDSDACNSPKTETTVGSGYTIPLTEDEVKEMFSNGTKNDHEASGSGT